ncbi:hypothetical protein B0H14DRAFT_1293639 [Mycena olivaceomarginata]|nr:hypothetical protein B0H14DRAFT_1293639 [Mycena olivaceomarginata]
MAAFHPRQCHLTSWDYFWATAAIYGRAWLSRVARPLHYRPRSPQHHRARRPQHTVLLAPSRSQASMSSCARSASANLQTRVTGWRLLSLPLYSYLPAPSACACTSLARRTPPRRATPVSAYSTGAPSWAGSTYQRGESSRRRIWPRRFPVRRAQPGRRLAAGHRGWVRQLQRLVAAYRGHHACLQSRYRNFDGAIVLDLRH